MGEKRFFDRVHVLRTDVFDVFVLEHRGYRVQKHGGVAVWYYLHNRRNLGVGDVPVDRPRWYRR